jgi:predicted nucleic acid-binding protein
LLDSGALELIPQEQLLAEAVKLSIDRKHPLQDCLYLAAARRYDSPLLTADTVFHKRVNPFYRKLTLLAGRQVN